MATWVPVTPRLGLQAITETSTTQQLPLGTVITANDIDTSGQGTGEFIYLLGVAATVVGSVAEYNATTYQTTLSTNTANKVGPVAVAMSANVASQYGWYQIGGYAVVKKTGVIVLPGVALFQSGTTGRVMSTVASGKQFLGMRSANLASVVSATSTVAVMLDRPSKQGQVI
jgi:hypothetical protein